MHAHDLFEILVREHVDMLTLYLRSLVWDDQLADELVQETWVVAWTKMDRFDRSRPFGPWLRGIAAKLVTASRRQHARRIPNLDDRVIAELDARCEALARRPGDSLDEKLASLKDCVGSLPTHFQAAILHRYRDGLTGATLARRLDTSIENTKKLLQRGRRQLANCIDRKLGLDGASS